MDLKKIIYLDHNSTSYIKRDIYINEAIDLLGYPINPSSTHTFGRYAKSILEEARQSVNSLVGLECPDKVTNTIFTSSATEANNIVMKSFYNQNILVLATEHASIINHTIYNKNIKIINVNKQGIIDLVHLEELLKNVDQSKNTLLAVSFANNETGVVQPMHCVIKIARRFNAFVHSDCVQAAGKINVDFYALDVDSISLSGHKIGALPGIGALIYKTILPLTSQMIGGGQEKNLRSGTENIFHAKVFGLAAHNALKKLDKYQTHTKNLQTYLESKITAISNKKAKIWSDQSNRLPNTSSIMMPNIDANIQMIKLDMKNFAIANGAACSSGAMGKPSHVLNAMNIDTQEAQCTIRVSTGIDNSLLEIKKFLDIWQNIYQSN